MHPLEQAFDARWPTCDWQEVTVLLAISGGADSVGLLRIMRALKTGGEGRLVAAHFNHQLRGDESAIDEAFVADLCRGLALPCQIERADGDAWADCADGLESAARTARYEFLQRTAAQWGARYVVTAHTADDQAETILHRVLRGTGIAGLAGMRRARPLGPAATLIRPLLDSRRAEILGYLADLGQSYQSDSSNDDLRFTRNRIRRQLLPQLAEQFNPAVSDALLRLGLLAGEVQEIVGRQVEELAQRSVLETGHHGAEIRTDAIAAQPRYLVRELLMTLWRRQQWPLQAMGFQEWDLLADMLLAPTGLETLGPCKRTFPGGVEAEIRDGLLRLVGPPNGC